MNYNLIIPIAVDKPEFEKEIPPVFSLNENGIMLCVKSILGMDLSQFNNIYFSVLEKHNKRYYLEGMFDIQFKRLGLENAHVVILSENTSSEPETVYQTIKKVGITGSIFIKDADCFFEGNSPKENSIAIYPLENMTRVNPQNKSYVTVDDMYYVTNIIEKRIVGHFFCAGGYSFEDVDEFCSYYEQLKTEKGLYLSHIIYSMLLDKHFFRPFLVKNFYDYD